MSQTMKFLIKVGQHSNLKFLIETNDVNEAKNSIDEYIKSKIKNSHYQRIIFDDPHIWIDYGSWTDFIYVYFLNLDAKIEYLGEELYYKMYCSN